MRLDFVFQKKQQMKKVIGSLLFVLFAITVSYSQSPIGIWKTVDDKSGKTRSKVEIYEIDGKIHGKIIDLLLKPNDTLCEECEGKLKNKPVVGLVIINDLSTYKDYWKNGTILDPETGSVYGCSIWFEEGKENELQVRGKHWTGIFRTQTWYRVL